MKNFLCTIAKKMLLFLIFACSLCEIEGMDSVDKFFFDNTTEDVKFLKKFKIWDNEELVNSGRRASAVVPYTVIIAPDEKGILITQYGRVDYIDTRTLMQSKPYELIKHTHRKYYPMVAAVMKKSNKLLVVSVLNDTSGAECIISHNTILTHPDHKSHNIFSKSLREDRKLNVPVQAIALSSDGEIIAIAFKNYIEIIDLLTNSSRKSNFIPRIQDSLVVDVSAPVNIHVGSNEQHLVAVNNKGVFDFKRLVKEDGDVVFTNLKDISTGEELIEKIHLTAEDLLYVTQKGEVKIINLKDWLEHSQGNIKDRIVSHHLRHKAAVDQDLEYDGTIHWINHSDEPESIRFQIQVRRENGTAVEDFVISMPNDLPKTCNFITKTGQIVPRLTHILLAALRRNLVVAIASDGYMYTWMLPEKYKLPTQEDVITYSQAEYYKDKLTRKRSFSSPIENTKNDEKRKSEKKSSSRVGCLKYGSSKESFKPSGLKGHTPQPSPSSSPRKRKEDTLILSPRNNNRRIKGVIPYQGRLNPLIPSEYDKALKDDIHCDFDRRNVMQDNK